MKKYDENFISLVNDFKNHENVEAVLLSGSRTAGNNDLNSDYDLYVYINGEISLDYRHELAERYFSYYELNNTTWETEDQGFFKGNNVQIDIVYRNPNWIEEVLKKIVIDCQASTGYTTCFLANIIHSDILFDRDGKLKTIQDRYNVEYPDNLVKNIISKNFPLLKNIIPSYIHQIEKAIKRNDIISVNHRASAFFESYFDIIFAINKKLHPGEKKLINIASKLEYIPLNMVNDIEELLNNLFNDNYDRIKKLEIIVERLKDLLISINKDWNI